MASDRSEPLSTELPYPPAPLVGREAEQTAACALLTGPTVRLLTVTGPPGVGKTRFALEIAHLLRTAFTDGAAFVDLASLNSSSHVLSVLAERLAVPTAIESGTDDALLRFLRHRDVLLVLDNFEHLLDAAGDLAHLLERCPGLRLLVTSRLPLRLRCEHEFPLQPLTLPDPLRLDEPDHIREAAAVMLFEQRARAVDPAFALTAGNARAVAETCTRLDGLPLAIELAAAAVRTFEPGELSRRLENRLDFLEDSPRDMPGRQRTLRGAIGWSHGLLDAPTRTVFRHLAIFQGSFTLEAAVAVVSDARTRDAVPDALQSLLAGNLLSRTPDLGGEPRYRMLETIREFARERLAGDDQANAVSAAHARYYSALAEQAGAGLRGPDQAAWLDRLEQEAPSLRSALDWLAENDMPDLAAPLVRTLARFWWVRGHLREGRAYLRDLLSRPALASTSPLRAELLLAAGLLAVWHADYAEAEPALEAVIAAARDAGRPDQAALALTFLGRSRRDQGDGEAARELGAQAVASYRDLGDSWGLAAALHFLGLSSIPADDDGAQRCFDESAAIFRDLGDRWDLAMPLRGLGLVAYARGDHAQARARFEECLALFRERGDEWSTAMVLHDLGCVAQARGDMRDARQLFRDGLARWRRIGNARGAVICLAGLARVAARTGDMRTAALLWGAAETHRDAIGVVFEPTDSLGSRIAAEASPLSGRPRDYLDTLTSGRRLSLEEAIDAALEVTPDATDRSPEGAAALTPREWQVAALLRHGMSNRQIAEALTIAEGTASLHVKHILAKLRFESRAQIAAWAVEQGLETDAASNPLAREA